MNRDARSGVPPAGAPGPEPASPGPGRRAGALGRGLLNLALAGLGFGLAAAAIRPLVPWPEENGLAAKLRWWDEHAGDYDLVFVGSSRVLRGFDPHAFEEELRGHGVELRAFNFGVGGARAFEIDMILDAVLARRSPKLRWVLLDAAPLDPRFLPWDDDENTRTVFWHTPSHTLDALRSAASWPLIERAQPRRQKRSLSEILHAEQPWIAFGAATGLLNPMWRFDMARRHLQIMGWNVTSYGQGLRILGAWLDEDLAGPREDLQEGNPQEENLTFDEASLAAGQGYFPFVEDPHEDPAARTKRMLGGPKEFARRVREIQTRGEVLPDAEALNAAVVAAQQEEVRAAGAELVYVALPDEEARPEPRALEKAGKITSFLDFDRPAEWPELFTYESHNDYKHLSRAGSLLFSRELARAFAEHLQGAGPSAR